VRTDAPSSDGWLAGEARIVGQLRAGQAADALAACDELLPQLGNEARVRNRWRIHETRARALLALHDFEEARQEADAALAVIMPLGWHMLEWRLRACRAGALTGLGDATAREERKAAQNLLMQVAATLEKPALRAKFLAQPEAAALLA
jgi:hypothetical protein